MAYEKLTYITFSTKGQDLLKSMDRKGDIVSRFKWNIDCKCNQIEKKDTKCYNLGKYGYK